jgi:hypothetical protein
MPDPMNQQMDRPNRSLMTFRSNQIGLEAR